MKIVKFKIEKEVFFFGKFEFWMVNVVWEIVIFFKMLRNINFF